MKKVVAFLLMFMLFAGSAAYAEDGFSISVGYGGGYKSGKIDLEGASIKGNTPEHGPSFEARYEQGAFFSRMTFDYRFLTGGKTSNSSFMSDLKYDGHAFSIEGNIGYKLKADKDVSVIPYVGFGYHEWQSNLKESGLPVDLGFYYKTPYAVAGLIARYEQPKWSIGIDAAALITFAGEFGEHQDTARIGTTQDVGWGARVQAPLTYNLLPKKSGSVGIDLFLTPYFEYWDTKSSSGTFIFENQKFTQYTYGGKAGFTFKF